MSTRPERFVSDGDDGGMEIHEGPPAPECCGQECFLLGQLGRLLWFRCRGCGMDYNRDIAKGGA